MQCNERSRWQAMIIDRLANELGEEDAVLLEQHLSDCESCMREARTLAGVMQKASGPVEWAADQALEARLLGVLERRPAVESQKEPASLEGGGHVPAPGGGRDSAGRGRWRDLLGALTRPALRPPLSAGTGIALVLIAAAVGFWTGRVRPGGSLPPARVLVQDWVEAPADANRMPAPETGSGGPAADLLVASPSFARAALNGSGEAAGVDFVAAQSDAIVLPGRIPADSL